MRQVVGIERAGRARQLLHSVPEILRGDVASNGLEDANHRVRSAGVHGPVVDGHGEGSER